MSDAPISPHLPRRTVKYVTDPNQMTEAEIRGVVCNPVYTGIPPYPRMVTDEVWIKTAMQMIQEEGVEQFLVNMLYMLRNSMVDIVPDEAIPADYDGPRPGEETDDELISADSEQPATILDWNYPLEGLLYCSHDDLPMVYIKGEFLCVGEYLYDHLGDSCITDLITEPVFTLIFQNGHTLPLYCPDCGESIHLENHSDLLDTINGLVITDIEWDHELECLALGFGRPEDMAYEEEPQHIFFIDLNSARELTCPLNLLWHHMPTSE